MPIAWWPNLGVLLVASAIDIGCRRIPNWLTLPFLASGIAVHAVSRGFSGAAESLLGVALAALLFGIPCLLGGSGMGDLKLAAGVGAWIGPGQLWIAFIAAGIVGGVFAVIYGLWRGCLGRSLDRMGDLLSHFAASGLRPHRSIHLEEKQAVSIPYAPVIAVGTLFSFFAK